MKRIILLALFCVCAWAAIAAQSTSIGLLHGGSSDAVAADGIDTAEQRAGLWNDGKAVFSDIELLDLLLPAHYARGYKPQQPIQFSHKIHVEKSQIECQYCHSFVAKSAYSNVPPVELCMGCHKLVRTERPEIQKLKKYYDEKRPIEWEPVHNLPEHAHFPHERHIKAGVGCQNCHGQIQKMDVVERMSSMKMGFCVTCHRDKGATIDCVACHY